MVKINLLATQKTRKKKQSSQTQYRLMFSVLAVCGLIGGLGYGWHYLLTQVDLLRVEKVKLSDELTRLKAQVIEVEQFSANKISVAEKIKVIRGLQVNQTVPIRLLAHVSQGMPERVWLTRLAEQGGNIQLEGKATSNDEIVTFINALKTSPFFEAIEIEESRQVIEANIPIYTFKLKWRIKTSAL